MTYRACGTVDQDLRPWPYFSGVDKHLPGGQTGKSNSGSLFKADGGWFQSKLRAGAVIYSAKPPAARGNRGRPKTSSPILKRVAPYPICSTTPATSQPGM